jgi:putative transposase
MGNNPTPLVEGHFYHIYNRGINSSNLFFENDNYVHFLRLMDQYLDPVCEIYAWALLKNHFHLLVYIRKEVLLDKVIYSVQKKPTKITVIQQFSNWFNAYTKAINKRYIRTGSLFETSFQRKLVTNHTYFKNMIYYIHYNPVHHHFVKHPLDYPWTSYISILSEKSSKIQRNEVLNIFKSKFNFEQYHSGEQDLSNIEELIIE